MKYFKYKIFFYILAALLPAVVLASNTNGVIDSAYKYGWGENIGWINFGADHGNAAITDAAITGYAWSDNYGWINLSPTTSGVKNDGAGNLSGYAWGENLGWINFSGVTINSVGEFQGYAAVNQDNGSISFNCANTSSCALSDFKVKTDWRPRANRPKCNNAADDDGDGKTDYPADPGCSSLTDEDENDLGGANPAMFSSPSEPAEGFTIMIENGQASAASREVSLILKGGSDTKYVWLSENISFGDSYRADYDPGAAENTAVFILSDGEGVKTVYAKFCNEWGRCSGVVSDSIEYKAEIGLSQEEIKKQDEEKKNQREQTAEKTTAETISTGKKITETETVKKEKKSVKPLEKIIEKMKDFLGPIFPFFKPKPEQPVEIPLEKLTPKETPASLLGKWNLMPEKKLRQFVLSPLPEEIRRLAIKFPELKDTFDKVGIKRISDIAKLYSLNLKLPGLTEAAGAPKIRLKSGKLIIPEGIPLADLPVELKQQLPAEIIFAKAGKELIDFNIVLSINDQGKPRQKITTIANGPLKLAVKIESKVKSVKGYLVFKSKNKVISRLPNFPAIARDQLERSNPAAGFAMINEALAAENGEGNIFFDISYKLQDLVSSFIFAKPSLAYSQETPIKVEEELVLLEFDYEDPDSDGIYTAEIQAPAVEGEYEIITLIYYEDPELGTKAIRLTTVVDPEGYVFEKYKDKEMRVPGAIAGLYWLNPENKQYEIWPAEKYNQENPQVTDVSGKYSFLVPQGGYYLNVEAPGYLKYEGKPFTVKEGEGIHFNVELKTKYWWLKYISWQSILLIITLLLLAYNFYKDKMREKQEK